MTPKSSDYGRVFFQAEVFRAGRLAERRPRPSDTIIERARRVPMFRDCDVLVAGGGPAGTAAAIAAAPIPFWSSGTTTLAGCRRAAL
jgi:hypothetical protein